MSNFAMGGIRSPLEKSIAKLDLILKRGRRGEPFRGMENSRSLRYVNLWPQPIQNPPPIWIPGAGSIETWDFCAELGYNWLPFVQRI